MLYFLENGIDKMEVRGKQSEKTCKKANYKKK